MYPSLNAPSVFKRILLQTQAGFAQPVLDNVAVLVILVMTYAKSSSAHKSSST